MKIKNPAILALAALAISGCCGAGNQEAAVMPAPTMEAARNCEWKQISQDDLDFNPITKFRDEWFLLSSGCDTAYNAMTIAWGSMGELWGKNIVNVYVTSGRYTFKYMESNPYFTITAFPPDGRQALQYMGSHSGRDVKDKAREAGLTVEFTELGNPVFKEANLAIECKMLYRAELDTAQLPQEIREHFYCGRNEPHHMYVGEIVSVKTKESK